MSNDMYIPEGYERIKVVTDIYSLLREDFGPKGNVVLYPRRLSSDFDIVAERMADFFDIEEEELFIKYSERRKIEIFRNTLKEEHLKHAVDVILQDMEFLYSAGVKMHLRVFTNYINNKDAYNFHIDGMKQNFDRYMICYNDPVTQYVCNEDVVSISGHDALCKEGAAVYQFKRGDVWKSRVRNKSKTEIGVLWKKLIRQQQRRAFVHRACPSDKPRLMVVGDKTMP